MSLVLVATAAALTAQHSPSPSWLTDASLSGVMLRADSAPPSLTEGDLIPDLVISPGTGGAPTRVLDGMTLSELGAGFPFGPAWGAGVRTAAGELTGDNATDIAVAMGPGGGLVGLYDGATLAAIGSGHPFGPGFAGGVSLAVGDLDGDGRADIVAGQASGGGEVRVFSGTNYALLLSQAPFGASYAGGVNVAAGDVDGDGRVEVIASQATGGVVAVISGATHAVMASGAPYGGLTSGVFVAAGDVNGDGLADLVTAPGAGNLPVLVFDISTQSSIASFTPYGTTSPGGVRVAATDLTGDGRAEIFTVPGPGRDPELRIFDGATLALLSSRLVYDPGYTGGVFVSVPPSPPGAPLHPGAPGAPTGLQAAVLGGQVQLLWSPPTDGGEPTNYRVEVGTNPGLSDLASIDVGNVTSMTAPAPPLMLFVRVVASNAWGAGPASNEVTVVPVPPLGTGQFSATVTWDTTADIDLHVNEPTGDHVFNRTAATRRGPTALLDVENGSGYGPENIHTDRPAANGTYEVYVVPYAGEPARWPTVATITIRTNVGTPAEDYRVFTRTFTEPSDSVGQDVATVTFPGGVITEANGTRSVSYAAEGVVVNDWQPRRRGERRRLTATAYEGGAPVTTTFTWTSSDPAVIEITPNGDAIALDEGTATLTATAADSGATGDLTVRATDTGVVPRPSTGRMFTLWPPRGGEQPAVVSGGQLRIVNDVFCPGEPFPGTNPRLIPCTPGYTAYNDPDTLQTPWNLGGVAKLDWEGNLVGVLTDVGVEGAGTLRVLDRFEEWTLLGLGDIVDFSLETMGSRTAYPRAYRLGMVHADGRVRVKDGLHSPWTILAAANTRHPRLVLEGNRIGIAFDDGEVRVKDGIQGAWTVLASAGATPAPEDLVLEGNRIGIRYSDGRVRVKDGVAGTWTTLVDASGGRGAVELLLHGNRIAVRFADGAVQLKDGIQGPWWGLANGGVAHVALDGNRIGFLFTDGRLRVKDGLNGSWYLLGEGVVAVALQQGYVGTITHRDGSHFLRAKMHLNSPWTTYRDLGSAPVTQFRLIVDVPSKPFRVGPGLVGDSGWGSSASSNNLMNYGERRAACANGTDCYTSITFGVPVYYYGWYCGADSVNANRLDPVDNLCRHHDYAYGFYEAWGIDSLGVANACIVWAGAEGARLTDASGNPVPYDLNNPSSVDTAFSSMPAMGAALRYYRNWGVGGCLNPPNFLDATTSKR